MIEHKKIIIDIEDSKDMIIGLRNSYPVTFGFDNSKCIGIAKVYHNEDKSMILADFSLNKEAKGLYPAIGFISKGTGKYFEVVSLCVSMNLDKNIKPL